MKHLTGEQQSALADMSPMDRLGIITASAALEGDAGLISAGLLSVIHGLLPYTSIIDREILTDRVTALLEDLLSYPFKHEVRRSQRNADDLHH